MHKLTEQERASLLELSLDMFCVAGTDGYLRWLNPRWSAVLGWTHEELVSAPFIDFVHPDDLEATLAEVERLKQGLPAVQFENRYRHKNGTWRWLEWNTVPQPDGKLFCSVRDITLRKMLERRRSAQHTLLRMAEELGRLGHWRVDLAHQELFWSTEVFRIHGIPPEEGTPKLEEAINAYHPDDRAIVSANLNKAIAEHSGFEFELRLIHRDGSVRHVLCRGICEMAEDGSGPEAVFGIFVDLTDIKKGQQALEAQARRLELHNTMLSQFASIVSHDLRAPLRGITAVSTWIQEAVEEHQWDELPEYVELLLGRAERMGHMLKGLHHFVRVERAQVVQENVDMEELVRDILEDFDQERATVRCTDLPQLTTARAPLMHVLRNLIANAFAHHDRHLIQIHVKGMKDDASWVVFAVEDDGPGIPERFHERIFSPFQTLRPRDQVAGSGMGLAIVRRIVQWCGGEITVASPIDDGRGTRFVVRWPRCWAV